MRNSTCHNELVQYISKFEIGGFIPSYRHIAEALGWDSQPVRESLKMLGALGIIEISHGKRAKLISDPLKEEEHF